MTRPKLKMLKPRIGLADTSRVPTLTRTARATERDRGRPWRRLRAEVLAAEPLCRPCKAARRVTLATEVDHITPLWAGGSADDPANLQPICPACHRTKSARDAANAGRA